jgi:hypothetical protein
MRTDGYAPTLDEAKAQFETAWHRWLACRSIASSSCRSTPSASMTALVTESDNISSSVGSR